MAHSKGYLKTQSGKIKKIEELQKELKKAGTPEGMRFRELRNLLLKEAQPFVTGARQAAYEDTSRNKDKYRRRTPMGAKFYSLYHSIGKWANKGTTKAYVVVGLRSERKRGAYYAKMQLAGADKTRTVGLGKGQEKHKGYVKNGLGYISQYTIKPKDFITNAVNSEANMKRAEKMLERYLDKRFKDLLGWTIYSTYTTL